MSIASDTRFWNKAARKYAKAPVADQAGYERTLERTGGLLSAGDRVLELGCGTGTTALKLAGGVKDYLATDISAEMIAIAEEKHAHDPVPTLRFRVACAEEIPLDAGPFDAVLGFSYLHLVRDLPGTLARIHALLSPGGLFISKTPCIKDMNPLIRLVLLPGMRAIGKAPYAGVFQAADLSQQLEAAGFEIVAHEIHASKGSDQRLYIVARKM